MDLQIFRTTEQQAVITSNAGQTVITLTLTSGDLLESYWTDEELDLSENATNGNKVMPMSERLERLAALVRGIERSQIPYEEKIAAIKADHAMRNP